MRIALLHLLDDRPKVPDFQRALDALISATAQAVASLGWQSERIAGESVPIRDGVDAVLGADAVIVLGGEDVTPLLYDGQAEYPGGGHHLLHADAAHILAIHTAIAHRIPLLGICRGMQLINVALGGSLIQDLGPQSPHRSALPGVEHFPPMNIVLSPDTDLRQDVVESEPVYCSHHQAIARLGIDLRIAARSADGGIEAVVHDFAPVTGVQWHPEHPATSATQLVRLLRRLERQRAAENAA